MPRISLLLCIVAFLLIASATRHGNHSNVAQAPIPVLVRAVTEPSDSCGAHYSGTIGGLAIATFITLLIVPVLYAIFVKDLRLGTWKDSLEKHGDLDHAASDKLLRLLRYVDGDYNDPATFKALRGELGCPTCTLPRSCS